MSWAYAAALLLVGAGLSLAFALLWLSRAAQKRRHVLNALLGLRERLEQAPLEGLAEAGALVLQLGLPGMRWQGQWYGAAVSGSTGDAVGASGALLAHQIRRPDISIDVQINLRGLRGEARLFAEQSAQLLFAILEGALAARELALGSAMAQRARVAVFLQHDMRNLAQWVELVADDLGQTGSADQLLASARRMQPGLPMARDRAQRIAASLARPPASTDPLGGLEELDLVEDLTQAAAMHQVHLNLNQALTGVGRVRWNAVAWATVLDNLLGNISRVAREQMTTANCNVRWMELPQGMALAFDTPELPLRVPIEHLFEPWSGSTPGGSGLGLYQARRAALAAGGNLRATHCGTGLTVTLLLPRKNS